MTGDFLFPVFHRTELVHTPALLSAENVDQCNGTMVMLKSVDSPMAYGKKLETIRPSAPIPRSLTPLTNSANSLAHIGQAS